MFFLLVLYFNFQWKKTEEEEDERTNKTNKVKSTKVSGEKIQAK
jgi:hypothetical protein